MVRFSLICIPIIFFISCSEHGQRDGPEISGSDSMEITSSEKRVAAYDTTVNYIRYSEAGLVEDLNGDGFQELVSLVANSKNNQIGVRIVDGKNSGKFHVFGAGNEVDGMTNLLWIGSMNIIPKGFYVAPTLIDSDTGDMLGLDSVKGFLLQTNAIHLLPKKGLSSAIIYWNEHDYSWMHQE